MKLRVLTALAVAVGVGLLACAGVAQGAPGIAPQRVAPGPAHAGPGAETIIAHHAAGSSARRVAPAASTAGFTAYLPFVARNHDSLRLFFDNFGDPNSGWYTAENEGWKVGYLDGEYQMLLKKTEWGGMVTPDLVLPEDFYIEVDARQASGNLSSYGLMFGIQYIGAAYEGYQLIVYPAAGVYVLEKRNTDASWMLLIDWTYSAAIGQGMATNHLRVDRIGTLVDIYINGTLVTTFADGSFTGAGRDAGIRAYSYDSVPVDVRFDNFGAYRIP
jgi:hypothetical protein